MDDYIEFFYEINPNARDVDTGDISTRIDLRKKLGCKDFKWYLETVYPGLVPQFIFLFDSFSQFARVERTTRLFSWLTLINHMVPQCYKVAILVKTLPITSVKSTYCAE